MNRKKILVPCLVIYDLPGLVSYFADMQLFLILRFIQGIGASALLPLVMLVIADAYKGRESLHAMSRVSMALPLARYLLLL